MSVFIQLFAIPNIDFMQISYVSITKTKFEFRSLAIYKVLPNKSIAEIYNISNSLRRLIMKTEKKNQNYLHNNSLQF